MINYFRGNRSCFSNINTLFSQRNTRFLISLLLALKYLLKQSKYRPKLWSIKQLTSDL